ncbi:hypothetical protein ASG76_12195 [Nocardioides sp. Soil774]|uniref:DUF6049 family protein n=1 Tax=Nocardioides sp. Soil774 TaxID=1736408 RepID=UPI0006F968CC|nr:DUF6049 family protein [Nocardioides sp. Soil774]KRE94147.1 hypothetical protein ASG76_12195 [Nocardioides sp. Soil774]
MPHPSSFRAALAGLLTLGATASLVCTGLVPPAAATPAEDPDPLVVHIDTISPELPRKGDVSITGTVTNVSDDTFTRVNLHAFSSQDPLLDATALRASAALDPSVDVGPRVTVPGTFDTVDELAPGETASFSDSVPVELLGIPDQEGVYWIGIHALGDGAVPRDTVADGRARTFIPRRPSGDGVQEASVILSVRSRVWYDEDGRISGGERWLRRLEEGGSLDGVLDMADSADGTPYSWLVDPAVLVALVRLAHGNPARSIGPDTTVPGQEPTPTETPTDAPATEGTQAPGSLTPPPSTESHEGEGSSDVDEAVSAAAGAWIQRFVTLAGDQPVLTLPFGDLDVSAAVRNDPTRFTEAMARSAQVMSDLGLPTRPTVAPTDDLLSPEAIAATPDDALVLIGDNAFALPPEAPTSVVRMLGHDVVVTSTGAEAGGPGPTAATDPLALRQRLLSEAALRLRDDNTAPLVVTLPTVWRGEDAATFFQRLDRPWLDVVPVEAVAARTPVGVPASRLLYSDTDRDAELDAASFAAATRATAASTLLEQVLTLQTTIEQQVRDEVLVSLSEQHRERPRLAIRAAGRVEQALQDDLGRISIEAPTAVTLSSDSGPFGATLVNGLDQPVTVQVRTTTDGELSVTGDGERRLGPRARSVLRYKATSSQAGVHSVRLVVTSVDGTPLGSSDVLPIRAARVSALIWIVMALGALVLFGMIGYRLPGQIRQRRAELAAAEQAEAAAPADTTTPTDLPADLPADPAPGRA